jgi:transposase
MKTKRYEEKQAEVREKIVVGVDPGKDYHQFAVLNEEGQQLGKSFSIPVSYEGYAHKLWQKLERITGACAPEAMVFAIENACNLWKTLSGYLTVKGYKVVLVSPLTTRCSRPLMNHDFSKTDPKDAFLVAQNAQRGHYDRYRLYSPRIESLHQLSIAYSKLLKDRVKNLQRLRSFMDTVFPEYMKVFPDIGVDTSLYLLARYFLPHHFLKMEMTKELLAVKKISQGNYGKEKLIELKEQSKHSIGLQEPVEETSQRLVLDSWIMSVRLISSQIKKIGKEMIALASGSSCFEILKTIKGISDLSAARLIAECRDFEGIKHYGQIEKFAGLNVRVSDSGRSRGARHINGIGNKRLNHLLNQMTEQVVRYVPEVGNKYMRRQLKKPSYRKNIIASIPQLLKLIMVLLRENRPYEFREEKVKEMQDIKMQYDVLRKKRKWRTMKFAA